MTGEGRVLQVRLDDILFAEVRQAQPSRKRMDYIMGEDALRQ